MFGGFCKEVCFADFQQYLYLLSGTFANCHHYISAAKLSKPRTTITKRLSVQNLANQVREDDLHVKIEWQDLRKKPFVA